MKLTKQKLKEIMKEVLEEGGSAGHHEGPEGYPMTNREKEEEIAGGSDIVADLQAAVAKWEPQTEEGIAYEADILEILDRWEEPLRLSAPTEDPWEFKKRLGLGGSVHDRLGGPRHREK